MVFRCLNLIVPSFYHSHLCRSPASSVETSTARETVWCCGYPVSWIVQVISGSVKVTLRACDLGAPRSESRFVPSAQWLAQSLNVPRTVWWLMEAYASTQQGSASKLLLTMTCSSEDIAHSNRVSEEFALSYDSNRKSTSRY